MYEDTQLPASGTGYQGWTPDIYQYRTIRNDTGEYIQPLPEYKHGYPVPTSAVRQLVYSGNSTWNTAGYDYSAYANVLRREPLDHQEPTVIINYYQRNNSGPQPVTATPIEIAKYAVSTGMIYVGPTQGNWGGIQTGQISQGGYNAY